MLSKVSDCIETLRPPCIRYIEAGRIYGIWNDPQLIQQSVGNRQQIVDAIVMEEVEIVLLPQRRIASRAVVAVSVEGSLQPLDVSVQGNG